MVPRFSAALFAVFVIAAPAARGAKPFGSLPSAEVERFLRQLVLEPSLGERLSKISARFLGTRYVRDPLGEGKKGKRDRGPLIDLRRVDCLTFVEQLLALAQRPTVKEATELLQRYRYKDGKIAYLNRRHFMELQWLPGLRGEGLLRDITRAVGGADTRVFEREVTLRHYRGRHRRWRRRLGKAVPVGRISLPYLTARVAARNLDRIPEGAILSLMRRTPRSSPVTISHVGIVGRRGRHLVFRHAISVKLGVIEERLSRYFAKHARDRATLGFHISEPLPAGGVGYPSVPNTTTPLK